MIFWAVIFFIASIVFGILGFGGFFTGRVPTQASEWAFGICLVTSLFFLVAYIRSRKNPE